MLTPTGSLPGMKGGHDPYGTRKEAARLATGLCRKTGRVEMRRLPVLSGASVHQGLIARTVMITRTQLARPEPSSTPAGEQPGQVIVCQAKAGHSAVAKASTRTSTVAESEKNLASPGLGQIERHRPATTAIDQPRSGALDSAPHREARPS